jgi:hypothetical protein
MELVLGSHWLWAVIMGCNWNWNANKSNHPIQNPLLSVTQTPHTWYYNQFWNCRMKYLLSRKPFAIGHVYIYTFFLRVTDTVTSQNPDHSSWDTLYTMNLSMSHFMHCSPVLSCECLVPTVIMCSLFPLSSWYLNAFSTNCWSKGCVVCLFHLGFCYLLVVLLLWASFGGAAVGMC